MVERWRVLIADDHGVTRAGVRVLLESIDDVDVIGEAATGAEAVQRAIEGEANLVVMDLTMPEGGGLEAIAQLKAKDPSIEILALTVHEEHSYAVDAINAGASGFLTKSASIHDVRAALDALRSGGSYIAPAVAQRLIRSAVTGSRSGDGVSIGPEAVTNRERDVLQLLAEGLSARMIAKRLGISERTVNTHVGNLYRRMGVTNRVDAIRAGMRAGLVEFPR